MITRDPKAEVEINPQLVSRLIQDQFPDLAHLELRFLDSGWDNENFRLGEEYIVRVPRRELALPLIQSEIKWLQFLKDKLPINIPCPVKVGSPSNYYPWPWTINPWFEGKSSNLNRPNPAEAARHIEFLKALHNIEAMDAPINKSRGVSLETKSEDVEKRMLRLESKTNLITSKLRELWKLGLNEPYLESHNLIHGDLHSRNIIVHEGKIEAIVDWGDITSGDPATDLGSLWMLFEEKEVRNKALEQYRADESLVNRARSWAIFFGVILLDTGLASNEQHAEMGTFILSNITYE